MESHDFNFRFQIDLVIMGCVDAVLCSVPVLAHHDNGRLNGRKHGEDQVQKYERVGIKGVRGCDQIDGYPDGERNGEDCNECPRTTEFRYLVCQSLSRGKLLVE